MKRSDAGKGETPTCINCGQPLYFDGQEHLCVNRSCANNSADRLGLGLSTGDSFFVRYFGQDCIVRDVLGGPGESGMGIVYVLSPKGVDIHPIVGGGLVLKTLQDHLLRDAESRQAFEREARIWTELGGHPNIVRAWFVDTHNGRAFIALEAVEGGSLRSHLQGPPLRWSQIILYGMDFCQGMSHCQRKLPGFVHGDVKPENCLLKSIHCADGEDDPFGVLAVTDFGLARVLKLGQPDGSEHTPVDLATQLLANGDHAGIAGTLPYIAPETLTSGGAADYRVDIYAFGIMFYEMITGRWPYEARSAEEMVQAHLEQQPIAPARLRADLPSDLAGLVLACLAKAPDRRPQTYEEIYAVLARLAPELAQMREALLAPYMPQPREAGAELVRKAVSVGNLGRNEEALHLLDQALSIDGDLGDAWHSKGVTLYEMGRWEESLHCTERAIDLWTEKNGDYFLALCLMIKGQTLRKLGRNAEARAAYVEAARLNEEIKSVLQSAGRV